MPQRVAVKLKEEVSGRCLEQDLAHRGLDQPRTLLPLWASVAGYRPSYPRGLVGSFVERGESNVSLWENDQEETLSSTVSLQYTAFLPNPHSLSALLCRKPSRKYCAPRNSRASSSRNCCCGSGGLGSCLLHG